MGFARRIIAFLIGIIIGVVSIFTGLAIAGSVFKVKDVTAVVNKGDVVGDELGDSTVLALLLKAMNGEGVVGDMETLGDVSEQVPEVERRVNSMIEDEPYKSYASLLGIESYDDVKDWRIDDIANEAVEAAKKNVTVERVFSALSMDAQSFEIPVLYQPAYIALTNNENIDGYAIIDKIAEVSTDGLVYMEGDNYVPAFENGVIKNQAKEATIYYDLNQITKTGIMDVMTVVTAILKNDEGQVNFGLITFDTVKDVTGIDVLGSNTMLEGMFDGDTNFAFAGDFTKISDTLENTTFGDMYLKIDADKDSIINKAISLVRNKSLSLIFKEGGIHELLDGITFFNVKETLDLGIGILDNAFEKIGAVKLVDVLDGTEEQGINEILNAISLGDIADIIELGDDNKITKLLKNGSIRDLTLKELLEKDENGKAGFFKVFDQMTFGDVNTVLGLGEDELLYKALATVEDFKVSKVLDGDLMEVLDAVTLDDVAHILNFGEGNMIYDALVGKTQSVASIINEDGGVQDLLRSFKLADIPELIDAKRGDVLYEALTRCGEITVGDILDTKKYDWNEEGVRGEENEEGETALNALLARFELNDVPQILGIEKGLLYKALNDRHVNFNTIINSENGIKEVLAVYTLDDVAKILGITGIVNDLLEGKTNVTLDLLLEEDTLNGILSKFTFGELADRLGFGEENIITKLLKNSSDTTADTLLKDGGLEEILDGYTFDDMAGILFGDKDGTIKRALSGHEIKLSVLLGKEFMDTVLEDYTLSQVANILYPDAGTSNYITRALRENDTTLKDVLADGGIKATLNGYTLDDVATILGSDFKSEVVKNALRGKTEFKLGTLLEKGGIEELLSQYKFSEINGIMGWNNDTLLYKVFALDTIKDYTFKDAITQTEDGKAGIIDIAEHLTFADIKTVLPSGVNSKITTFLDQNIEMTVGDLIKDDTGVKDLINGYTFEEINELLGFDKGNIVYKLLDAKKATKLGDLLNKTEDGTDGIQNFLDGFTFGELRKALQFNNIIDRVLCQTEDQSIGALLHNDEDGKNGLDNYLATLTFANVSDILDLEANNMITKALAVSSGTTVKDVLTTDGLKLALYDYKFTDVANILGLDVETNTIGKVLNVTANYSIGDIVYGEGIKGYFERASIKELVLALGLGSNNMITKLVTTPENFNLTISDVLDGDIDKVLVNYKLGDLVEIVGLKGNVATALTLDGIKDLTLSEVTKSDGVEKVIKGVTLNDVQTVLGFDGDNIITKALKDITDIKVYDLTQKGGIEKLLEKYTLGKVQEIVGFKADVIKRALTLDSVKGYNLHELMTDAGLTKFLKDLKLSDVATVLDAKDLLGRALTLKETNIYDLITDKDGKLGFITYAESFTFGEVSTILNAGAENKITQFLMQHETTTVGDLIANKDGIRDFVKGYTFAEVDEMLGIPGAVHNFLTFKNDASDKGETTVGDVLEDVKGFLNTVTFEWIAGTLEYKADKMLGRLLLTTKDQSVGDILNNGIDGYLNSISLDDISKVLYGNGEVNAITKALGGRKDLTVKAILDNTNSLLDAYTFEDVAYILGSDNIITKACNLEGVKELTVLDAVNDINVVLKGVTLDDVANVAFKETVDNSLTKVLRGHTTLSVYDILNGGIDELLDEYTLGNVAEILNLDSNNVIAKALTLETIKDMTVRELTDNGGIEKLEQKVTLDAIKTVIFGEKVNIITKVLDGIDLTVYDLTQAGGLTKLLDKYTLEKVANIAGLDSSSYIDKALRLNGIKDYTVKQVTENNGIELITKGVTLDNVQYILALSENNIITKALKGIDDITVYDVTHTGGIDKLLSKFTLEKVQEIAGFKYDSIPQKLLTLDSIKDFTVYSLTTNKGLKDLLKAIDFEDIAYLINAKSDTIYGRLLLLENKADTSVYDLLANKDGKVGYMAFAENLTLGEVATILGGNNKITEFLNQNSTTTVGELIANKDGIRDFIDGYTFKDLDEMLNMPGAVHNFLTLKGETQVGDVLKDVKGFLNTVTFEDIAVTLDCNSKATPLGRFLLATKEQSVGDILNNGVNGYLNSLKLKNISEILFANGEDNYITRACAIEKLADKTIKELLTDKASVTLKAVTLDDVQKVLNLGAGNIITEALKENKTDLYTLTQKGGIETVLENYTLGRVQEIVKFKKGSLPEKILTLDTITDLTLKQVAGEGGVKLVLEKVTLDNVQKVLALGDGNMVTKALKGINLNLYTLTQNGGIDALLKEYNLGKVSSIVFGDKKNIVTRALTTEGVDGFSVYTLVKEDGAIKDLLDEITFGELKTILNSKSDLIVNILDQTEGQTLGSLTTTEGFKSYLKKLTFARIIKILDLKEGPVYKALNEFSGWNIGEFLTDGDALKNKLNTVTFENINNILDLKEGPAYRALNEFKDWNVGKLLTEDGTLKNKVNGITFANISNILAFGDHFVTRFLGLTPETTIDEVVGGDIKVYLKEVKLADFVEVLKLKDGDLLTKALEIENVGKIDLATLTGADGVNTLLKALTLDDVVTVAFKETDDNYVTRAFDGKTNLTLKKVISNGGLDLLLKEYTFEDVANIIKTDNVITKFLKLDTVKGLNVYDVAKDLNKVLEVMTLDDVVTVVFKETDDNYVTRAFADEGVKALTLKQVMSNGGLDLLLKEYTFEEVANILKTDNVITKFLGLNTVKALNVYDVTKDLNKVLEIMTLDDVATVAFKETDDNYATRALRGKTVTLKASLNDILAAYNLGEVADIIKTDNVLTKVLKLEDVSTMTVKDALANVNDVLKEITLDELSTVLFGTKENYVTKALKDNDLTIYEMIQNDGIEKLTDKYTLEKVATILYGEKENIITKLLKVDGVDALTVKDLMANDGISKLLGNLSMAEVGEVLEGQFEKGNLIYTVCDRLGAYTVKQLLTKKGGELTAFTAVKENLTLSDLGLNLVDYKLFKVILVDDGAELKIGDIIGKNLEGSFAILDRIKTLKLNKFVGSLFASDNNLVNVILGADKDITVGQLLDTKDKTVYGETALLHLLKALKLSDVGLDLTNYKLYTTVCVTASGEMTIGQLIGQSAKGELGVVTRVKNIELGKFYKVIDENEGSIINKVVKEKTVTVGEILDTKTKYVWDEQGNKTESADGKTALTHLIYGLKLKADLGVELGDEDSLFHKITYKNGEELTLEEVIDGVNDITIKTIVGEDVVNDNAVLKGIADLTIGNLSDSKKYDFSGETPVESASGETYMSHAINGIELAGVLGIEATDTSLLGKIAYKNGVAVTIGGISDRIDELSIGDIVGDVDNAIVNTIKHITVGDLSNPATLTNTINGMKLEAIIGENATGVMASLKDLTVGDLSDSDKVTEAVNGIKLADILGDTTGNKILSSIVAGDTTVGGLSAKVQTLTIGELVDTNGNKVLEYLATAKIDELANKVNAMKISDITGTTDNAILTALGEITVADLGNGTAVTDAINGMLIEDIVPTSEGTVLYRLIHGVTVSGMGDRMSNVTMGEILGVTETSPKILQFLSDKKLDDMSTLDLTNVKLGDVIAVTEGTMLAKLADTKIGEMENGVKSLTLGDVITVGENDVALLKALKDTKIGEMSTAMNNLTVESAFGVTVFVEAEEEGYTGIAFAKDGDTYTVDEAGTYKLNAGSGIWLMLLYTKGTGYEYTKASVTVGGITDAMANVTTRFETMTMYEFYLYGFLSTEPSAYFAEMTLSGLMSR